MKRASFQVTGMTCAACQAHVERAVRAVEGVENVSVNLLLGSMQVAFAEDRSARSCKKTRVRA